MRPTLAALVFLTTALACGRPAPPPAATETGGPAAGEPTVAPDVEERLARFAPTAIEADLSALSPEDRKVLGLVVRASRPLDEVFLRQAWAGNPGLAAKIAGWKEAAAPEKAAAWQYFRLNFGPWDRLESMEPFLGDAVHPPGAGFYPEDLSREEMESYLAAHPDQKEALTSTVTVVRRDGDALVAVPYSEAYREWLTASADLLRQAAAAASNETLKRFLELRADAFASDDYYESDFAWMDLDAPVEVTIGPYETYEDELFGYKASFESFVTVALPAESAALTGFKTELPWLERNLPIPDEHKNFNRGTDSPIRVVDLVATAGDAAAGVMTLAYNLPNDERVREAKGSKKVLMRNVMHAKYDRILVPIAERVLAADQVGHVSFDAYFDEVLHHELAHGLGPGKITVDGRPTEVRLELKDLYSTLEEAKADVMGVYDILALVDKGTIDRALLDSLEPTYVAGLFRAARFGVGEAHGQGVVAQFNYLLEKGALAVDADGRFRAVPEKFPAAIRALLHDMLMLQARGDYAATAEFLARYGTASASLLAAIDRLGDVPVDIRPIFAPVPEG
jgi:Peptidase family M49